MITFAQLEQAFAPLSEIGHRRKTFDMFGMQITLKTLLPSEESKVQRTVSEMQEEGDSLALEFLDQYRIETLCRAIVKINEVELSYPHVLTGETLPSGVEVKIPREEAILKIISNWSRPVISQIFNSYALLLEEVEKELDEKYQIKNFDTKDEKKNLENRIASLEQAESISSVSNQPQETTKYVNSEYTDALEGMGQ
jgi:hypothetical protein